MLDEGGMLGDTAGVSGPVDGAKSGEGGEQDKDGNLRFCVVIGNL